MRRAVVAALAVSLLAALAPVGRSDTAAPALARVKVTNAAEARFVAAHYDETHNHVPGYVEVVLWPGDEAELAAAGLEVEILAADLLERDRSTLESAPASLVRLPGPDRTDYRTLSDYVREMKNLARKHPRLVKLLKMPFVTREGRNVYGVEIAARVRRSDGRPTFYVDGVHHAREWPAGEYPMIFAHHLVERYQRAQDVRSLLRRVRVVIVPLVNPDGFDYSRGSVQAQNATVDNVTAIPASLLGIEAYWRKNRRSFTGVTVPEAKRNPDAYGVDPNRNYAYEWGDDIGGSSGEPLMQTYRGPAPFSEPETRNVRALFLSRFITGVITNHTYGDLVLRAWGHTERDSPDEDLAAPLGARMARAMGGYSNLKGIALYATTGTTDDWAYAATSALGFTFEHGDAFHPPYATSVGEEWRGVVEAFTIGARAATDPATHSVIAGRVVDRRGRPVKARVEIFKSVRTPLWEDNPSGRQRHPDDLHMETVTDGRGRFEWHVNPSTRPFIESLGGRESFRLVVHAGGDLRAIGVTVDRGERVDVGTLRLRRPGRIVLAFEGSEG
ncbi:MAG: M14 family zinc carboxypeptidase [Actinomycetota bacterium]